MLAIIYTIGFLVTLWTLQDAEITMMIAHRQWEIHEETALKIAVAVWAPVIIATLAVVPLFRRVRGQKSHRSHQ